MYSNPYSLNFFFFKYYTNCIHLFDISTSGDVLSALLFAHYIIWQTQTNFWTPQYVLQQLNLANVTTRICTQGGFVNFVYIVQSSDILAEIWEAKQWFWQESHEARRLPSFQSRQITWLLHNRWYAALEWAGIPERACGYGPTYTTAPNITAGGLIFCQRSRSWPVFQHPCISKCITLSGVLLNE